MASRGTIELSSYEPAVVASGRSSPGAVEKGTSASLPESLLVRNVLWFCRLRWIVVAIFVAFGILGLFPELLPRIGLRPHPEWPFVAAAVLTLANLGYLAHARHLARSTAPHEARGNLWVQIVLDLLVLTPVVHYMGSLETYVAFAYLFHIVLACIFFPRSWSFAVTVIACGLYVACVALEETHLVAAAGIYTNAALREQIDRMPGVRVMYVGWAILTWGVVWYLASRLSEMVRERDSELAETNRRLLKVQEEKTRLMVRTTHELKAPFSAILANVQLFLKRYRGVLPDEAQDILLRVLTRCRRLTGEIQELLQLANLRTVSREQVPGVELDLAEVLRSCTAQFHPLAEQRGVVFEEHLQPARAVAVEDQLKMLFANLLSNAVLYSHPGGRVEVRCAPGLGNGPVVAIKDHGIGISPDKLPHIFDEFYRTDEAVEHYKESTGLGLAIVRQVAETHGIRLRVESAPAEGTTFVLRFPPAGGGPGLDGEGKEVSDGLSNDRGRR
ncbi:MAG: sensor histidine kinase [Armatimonadota bacterium]